jgi:hypothetical protein
MTSERLSQFAETGSRIWTQWPPSSNANAAQGPGINANIADEPTARLANWMQDMQRAKSGAESRWSSKTG